MYHCRLRRGRIMMAEQRKTFNVFLQNTLWCQLLLKTLNVFALFYHNNSSSMQSTTHDRLPGCIPVYHILILQIIPLSNVASRFHDSTVRRWHIVTPARRQQSCQQQHPWEHSFRSLGKDMRRFR